MLCNTKVDGLSAVHDDGVLATATQAHFSNDLIPGQETVKREVPDDGVCNQPLGLGISPVVSRSSGYFGRRLYGQLSASNQNDPN